MRIKAYIKAPILKMNLGCWRCILSRKYKLTLSKRAASYFVAARKNSANVMLSYVIQVQVIIADAQLLSSLLFSML